MPPIKELSKLEGTLISDTIVKTGGKLVEAAKLLGIHPSTLKSKLTNNYPKLDDKARKLRGKNGHSGSGRRRLSEPERSKLAVRAAWKKSEHVLAEAARILKLPASSVRALLVRYSLIEN